MTGPEHYAAGERALRQFDRDKAKVAGWTVTPVSLTLALVHFTAAQAAAAIGTEAVDAADKELRVRTS